jgi:hypothetical protein
MARIMLIKTAIVRICWIFYYTLIYHTLITILIAIAIFCIQLHIDLFLAWEPSLAEKEPIDPKFAPRSRFRGCCEF